MIDLPIAALLALSNHMCASGGEVGRQGQPPLVIVDVLRSAEIKRRVQLHLTHTRSPPHTRTTKQG